MATYDVQLDITVTSGAESDVIRIIQHDIEATNEADAIATVVADLETRLPPSITELVEI